MSRVAVSDHALPGGAVLVRLTLAAPRANALEPALLAELHAGLDRAEAAGAGAVLIEGGRNFSTGGDVGRFLDAARRGEATAYSDTVVPELQRFVLRLLTLPAVVAVAARGAVTGGSAGLLFAADLAVLAPDAFVQPYYARMGFAPDGGWTALLPERIGAGAAQSWLVSDRRVDAPGAVALGLAAEVCDDPEGRAVQHLSAMDLGMAAATKALVWDAERRAAVARRLEAETRAFRHLIGRDETRARMEAFLARTAAADA